MVRIWQVEDILARRSKMKMNIDTFADVCMIWSVIIFHISTHSFGDMISGNKMLIDYIKCLGYS
jgi:hypothetical protein